MRQLLGLKPKEKPQPSPASRPSLALEKALIPPGQKETLLYFTEKDDSLSRLKGYIMGYKSRFDAIQKNSDSPEQKQLSYRQLLASMHHVHQMFLRGKGHMESAFNQLPDRYIFQQGEEKLRNLKLHKTDNRRVVCVVPVTQSDDIFLNEWWRPFAAIYRMILGKINTTNDIQPPKNAKNQPSAKKLPKKPAKLSKYQSIAKYINNIQSRDGFLYHDEARKCFRMDIMRLVYHNPKLGKHLKNLSPTELLGRYGVAITGSSKGFAMEDMERGKFIRELADQQQIFETNLANLKTANIPITHIDFYHSYFRFDPYLKNVTKLTLINCLVQSGTDHSSLKNLEELTMKRILTLENGAPKKRLSDFSFLLNLPNLKKLTITLGIGSDIIAKDPKFREILQQLKNRGVQVKESKP